MNIVLIRHGETPYNTEHRIYGHAQIPLNQRGQAQAYAVGQRLRTTAIRAIYSSDLIRAVDTAQAIATHHNLPVHIDTGFREVDVGAWEHLSEADVAQQYPVDYAAFRRKPGEAHYTGGESFVLVQQRAWQALQRCITQHQPNDTVCIVCHAGTISAIVCAILQVDINHHPRIRIDNCAVSTLRITDDEIQLTTLNDNTHTSLAYEVRR